jgi:spartin
MSEGDVVRSQHCQAQDLQTPKTPTPLSPPSTMHHPQDAFILLALPDTSLTLGGRSENGMLNLECVTVPNPEATNKQQRDVYLVLRVNATEIPLDPARVINRTDTPFFRSYTFARTESEPTEILLRVKTQATGINPELTEKLDTFESILEQYAVDFRRPSISGPIPYENPPDVPPKTQPQSLGIAKGEKDFRGHLVMVNEDTGEIIGEIQDNLQIYEDPAMYEVGHRNDPVVIEVPEETTRQSDANARQAFASLIPPDQQNWVTKSASMFRYAAVPFLSSTLLNLNS